MIVERLVITDVTTITETDKYQILSGPISIQPIITGLTIVGTPTYTLMVSNDSVNYVDYNKLSTNVDVSKSVQINYQDFPWKFIKITINIDVGDLGRLEFLITSFE
jgi:hypothetical protein